MANSQRRADAVLDNLIATAKDPDGSTVYYMEDADWQSFRTDEQRLIIRAASFHEMAILCGAELLCDGTGDCR